MALVYKKVLLFLQRQVAYPLKKERYDWLKSVLFLFKLFVSQREEEVYELWTKFAMPEKNEKSDDPGRTGGETWCQ